MSGRLRAPTSVASSLYEGLCLGGSACCCCCSWGCSGGCSRGCSSSAPAPRGPVHSSWCSPASAMGDAARGRRRRTEKRGGAYCRQGSLRGAWRGVVCPPMRGLRRAEPAQGPGSPAAGRWQLQHQDGTGQTREASATEWGGTSGFHCEISCFGHTDPPSEDSPPSYHPHRPAGPRDAGFFPPSRCRGASGARTSFFRARSEGRHGAWRRFGRCRRCAMRPFKSPRGMGAAGRKDCMRGVLTCGGPGPG